MTSLKQETFKPWFSLVMYINESVLIDKETASRLKSVINTTLIVTNIPYIIMALGVFFGLIFTWLACRGQGSTDEGTADERAPSYEPSQTVSRVWGRKHAHCCDLGHDDMGQPSVSSRVCRLVRQEEGHPVPACDEHLPAEVQEQADLVGR